ncbi:MAG: alpha/beta hydrolase [Acidimicrobiia bacterium]
MDDHFQSDGLRIAAHASSAGPRGRGPAVVLTHGFPSGAGGGSTAGLTFPQLADEISSEAGCSTLTFSFRGCGASEGDFSIGGWVADVRAAIAEARRRFDPTAIWLVGFGTGGALAIRVAAEDENLAGVATLGSPRSLRDWARDPGRLIRHSRSLGLIRSEQFPANAGSWARAMKDLDSVRDAGRITPRPMLIVHGADDDSVPVTDARRVAEAAGDSAELRIIPAAGHLIRYDPRAVATLLGWLERKVAL